MASVPRIQGTIARQGPAFLNRVFTPKEQRYCESKRMKFEHYAARFAAKEAFVKALGSGWDKTSSRKRRPSFLAPAEIEILRRANGRPFISLSKAVRIKLGLPRQSRIEVSLSHEREYAIATVLVLIR